MERKNIQGVGLDVEADATAEQVFSKRPLHFFLDFDHLKVDATAQQAFFEGPEEYSRGRSRCRSRCNSRTGVFEKTPSFFCWILITFKWMQLRKRHFLKVPKNCYRRISGSSKTHDVEADATAEHASFKDPLKVFGGSFQKVSEYRLYHIHATAQQISYNSLFNFTFGYRYTNPSIQGHEDVLGM